MIVQFWGVRGSFPTPSPSFSRYGGHTSCVEVRCGERVIILDAGTGLIDLSAQLQDDQYDILLSHTHLDHIHGLLFFKQAYDKTKTIRLWAGHLLPQGKLQTTIGMLMQPPVFPLTTRDFAAQMEYHDFTAGSTLEHSAFSNSNVGVKTLALNHPDRATGYRIEFGGAALCYITDIEHREGEIDGALAAFVSHADCLIYDSTYSDDEWPNYRGWGHSTWQQGARLAQLAGVKQFVAFHHDPSADDAILDRRAQELKASLPHGVVAKEGMQITIG